MYSDPLILIPEMPDCNGCGRCCGHVTCSPGEAERISRYVAEHGVAWKERGLLACGFLDRRNRCTIYPVRPLTCRLYGVVHEMICPFFPDSARMSLPAGRLVAMGYEPDGPLLAQIFGWMP